MTATVTDIVVAVVNGQVDEHLKRIEEAVRSRQRVLSDMEKQRNRLTITAGTKVRLKGLRPQYLNGIVGVVEPRHRWRGQRIAVNIGDVAPRFGSVVQAPAVCVEPINE